METGYKNSWFEVVIRVVILPLTILGAFEGVQCYKELKKHNAETDSRVKAEEIHDKLADCADCKGKN